MLVAVVMAPRGETPQVPSVDLRRRREACAAGEDDP